MSATISIVVPVHDGDEHLEACLDGLLGEAAKLGARVVVVDDGSTDRTGELLRRYEDVHSIHLDEPQGPYAARNAGWRSSDSEVVVFTDVRCRPRNGWLEALVKALDHPGVAIAGGDIVYPNGPSVAERYLHAEQPFLASKHLSNPSHSRLPYLPTGNLATRRDVLELVGGFVEARSGSDVRFSWAAQLAGAGRLVRAEGAEMQIVPRTGAKAVLDQWRRYGAENARLDAQLRAEGHERASGPSVLRAVASVSLRLLRSLAKPFSTDWQVELLRASTALAYAGTSRAHRIFRPFRALRAS